MPIAGTVLLPARETPYFSNLDQLDAWASSPASKIEGVLPYFPRPANLSADGKGRMLVCHDYKGGYTESPFARCYTFNYYSQCDVFVYFSHNRVAIPPPGWINSAHRQGSKMLGTLIFEGGAEADCLRLCVGQYPAGVSPPPLGSATFPLSAQYATELADLAYQRGFDGWLMNFETSLDGGADQARAVAGWLTILQSELEAKVGPHAETIWYDSVTTDGWVSYQNCLNAYNLPFFLSSTGLFTNYWWYPDSSNDPQSNASYFNSLSATLTGNAATSQPEVAKKETNDIFIGLDVWGRGSYGGAGFGLYQALTHVAPLKLKVSAALFAPGWTWETQESNAGWTWDQWWGYDHSLWVGSGSDPAPSDPASAPGAEGPFVPIASYFALLGPPDPILFPFFSTFSPGTGTGWFVGGVKVFQSANGWADLDKQTAIGDLVWPLPVLSWHTSNAGAALPHTSSAIATDDGYMGGSSLRLGIFHNLTFMTTSTPIWLPVQSLNITLAKSYQATVYYKVEQPATDPTLTIDLYVKPLGTDISASAITVTSVAPTSPPAPISAGWKQVVISFTTSGTPATKSQVALGLVLSSTDGSTLPDLSILLGQISVTPSLPDAIAVVPPIISFATFTPSTGTTPSGTLSWNVSVAIPSSSTGPSRLERPPPTSASDVPARYKAPVVVPVSTPGKTNQSTLSAKDATSSVETLVEPGDTVSAWKLQPSNSWFPTLAYANIYAIRFASASPPTAPPVPGIGTSNWIGTSGMDGRTLSFLVVGDNLPAAQTGQDKVRFWVQGVTNAGELLSWDRCAYVDVSAS